MWLGNVQYKNRLQPWLEFEHVFVWYEIVVKLKGQFVERSIKYISRLIDEIIYTSNFLYSALFVFLPGYF